MATNTKVERQPVNATAIAKSRNVHHERDRCVANCVELEKINLKANSRTYSTLDLTQGV